MATKIVTRNQTCQDKLDFMREDTSKDNKYSLRTDFASDIMREPYERVTDTVPFKSRYLSAFRDGFEITPDMLSQSEKDVAAQKSENEGKGR